METIPTPDVLCSLRSAPRCRALVTAALAMVLGACGSESPAGPSLQGCDGLRPLAPGEVVEGELPGDLCIQGTDGAEYVLVAFLEADASPNARRRVVLSGEGIVTVDGAEGGAAASASPGAAGKGAGPHVGLPEGLAHREEVPALEQDVAFHRSLRLREIEELEGRFRPAREAVSGGDGLPEAAGVPAEVPTVGEELTLDVSPSCGLTDPRSGRVAAVTDRAVVVHDVANPAPVLQDGELRAFAETFDQVVYPLVTGTFGEPWDLDGNGRVILFFTRGVNDQGLAGSSIVSGYFWSGDLFPSGECASSNGAEILYLMVPDEAGVGGAIIDKEMVEELTVATMGHELQHLVNASRRIFVNEAPGFEETWLNEGLSVVVEELLFYLVSGLGPRANLGSPVTTTPGLRDAFRELQLGNVGRYNLFLQSPRSFSPMGADALATRGATWSYLRYVLDRDPGDDRALLRTLVNTTSRGLANVEAALGADPLGWMEEWSLSLLLDDLGVASAPRWEQPSWNFRELIPPLRPDRAFPLRLLDWQAGTRLGFDLQPGSAAHARFGVAEGSSARVRAESDELREGERVVLQLVRTR